MNKIKINNVEESPAICGRFYIIAGNHPNTPMNERIVLLATISHDYQNLYALIYLYNGKHLLSGSRQFVIEELRRRDGQQITSPMTISHS